MRKRNKWHKHRSKGLDTKYGGPCRTLKVIWWEGTPARDTRLKEVVK